MTEMPIKKRRSLVIEVLWALIFHGPLTFTEIKTAAKIEHKNLRKTLIRLQEAHLVYKEPIAGYSKRFRYRIGVKRKVAAVCGIDPWKRETWAAIGCPIPDYLLAEMGWAKEDTETTDAPIPSLEPERAEPLCRRKSMVGEIT